MTHRLVLILGGARSGKSTYAERLARESQTRVLYVATSEAGDEEMAARIAQHRTQRPAHWITLEAPRAIGAAVRSSGVKAPMVLVDCLTLWLSNAMQSGLDIEAETAKLQDALAARSGPTVIVSNEVGLGIVPDNALARRFRDLQGMLNQKLAAQAQRVIMMVAGVPVAVKSP